MASCLPSSSFQSFIEEIPNLLKCHKIKYPKTKNVEAKYKNNPPKTPQDAVCFIKDVCDWSGPSGNRVRSQILSNRNTPQDIKDTLSKAYHIAKTGKIKDVAKGVDKIGELYGLRQSYASKMLRFLLPEYTVILDSIIRNKCSYRESMLEYEKFLDFCHDVLNHVKRSNILPPKFKNGLRVCDIEAALFIYVQL